MYPSKSGSKAPKDDSFGRFFCKCRRKASRTHPWADLLRALARMSLAYVLTIGMSVTQRVTVLAIVMVDMQGVPVYIV